MTLLLGTHNLTEGKPTPVDLRCDLFAGQEVGRGVRLPFTKADRRVFRPTRDKAQCLAWNPDKIEAIQPGYRRFHGSGEHEDFGRIRTPSRGLVTLKALDEDGKVAVGGTWLLNSWGKPGEAQRRTIVTEMELPVIKDWVRDMLDWGAKKVYLMGDFNNVRWNGAGIGPMRQIAGGNGLDRIFVHGPVGVKNTFNGPTTGVGPDHYHPSVHALVT